MKYTVTKDGHNVTFKVLLWSPVCHLADLLVLGLVQGHSFTYMSNRSFVVNSIVKYTGDFSCVDAACGIWTTSSLWHICGHCNCTDIKEKTPVCAAHTLILKDIGPLRHSSKSERSLQTPEEGDDLKLCERLL